ncbi:MAG: hypothetical protein EHM46_02470 [Bacteroidetes bacterium]|nr:MAG: hypothetical protein EHM46_02470 [Bacteroidota bacterium]
MMINIRFPRYRVEAELYDTPTGHALYDSLPITRNVIRWGDEIYFEVPVTSILEPGAKAEVQAGDLAYWPNMPAFCIFFGPTPVSRGAQPVAASPVNVVGRLKVLDLQQLKGIHEGENVTLERVS